MNKNVVLGICDIVRAINSWVSSKYSKYNLWRKPEVQVPGIFNYEEMLHLNNQWQALVARCENLKEKIPAEAQDAFYQLVYYPAVASAGVAMIYNATTMGDRETIEALMEKDSSPLLQRSKSRQESTLHLHRQRLIHLPRRKHDSGGETKFLHKDDGNCS